MAYQYGASRTSKAELEHELLQALRGAQRVQSEMKRQLSKLRAERDWWALEIQRQQELPTPAPAPAVLGDPEDLAFQDSLISRCGQCGAWVYDAPLCKYHAQQEESTTA